MSIVNRRLLVLNHFKSRYKGDERDELANRLFGISGKWLIEKIRGGSLTTEEEVSLYREIGMAILADNIEREIHEHTQAH